MLLLLREYRQGSFGETHVLIVVSIPLETYPLIPHSKQQPLREISRASVISKQPLMEISRASVISKQPLREISHALVILVAMVFCGEGQVMLPLKRIVGASIQLCCT